MSKVCLTLLCPPEVGEKLLDLLLLQPNARVFSSSAPASRCSAGRAPSRSAR